MSNWIASFFRRASKVKPAYLGLLIGFFGTAVVVLIWFIASTEVLQKGGTFGGFEGVFLCVGFVVAGLVAIVGAGIGAMVEALKMRKDD